MQKANKARPAQIWIWICIIAAVIALCYILANILQPARFSLSNGGGTRFDFMVDGGAGGGFYRETLIYTENGITSIAFTGKLTVDGTAGISITSAEDGHVAFEQTYTDLVAKAIKLEVVDLLPDSYYTLRFYSDSAKSGNLALASNQSLVKRPERPEKPTPAIPG